MSVEAPVLITSIDKEKIKPPQNGDTEFAGGTLYVSKPFRSKRSNKLKAAVSFVPRTTYFDTTNQRSGMNEFRGFFTLFWISTFLLVVQNFVRSFETHGYPIKLAFAAMFSRDAKTLAISDAVLLLSSVLAVPYVQAIRSGWLQYYWTGFMLQIGMQLIVLATAVLWTFDRHWPWVQSGFFTLHTLVMIMKVHSYISTNGYLGSVHSQYEHTMKQLRTATTDLGGWERAVADAKAYKASLTGSGSAESLSPAQTPEAKVSENGVSKSYIDEDIAVKLRHRLINSANSVQNGNPPEPKDEEVPEAHLLVDHPNSDISTIAEELVELNSELTSTGPEKVRWPENIGYLNYADYLLVPSLVYELEFPRTASIRPLYVIEKTVATFGTFALLYTVTENIIIPLTPTKEQSFWKSLLDLALPFMMAYLLLFYIMFECICNGFAELSRFGDRRFYEDWSTPLRWSPRWNSTSWDEFARKWNKPVHTFLLRHVYASSIASGKVSKTGGMFLTFFISAVAHELVMAIVTQKIRLYLFMLQLIQIPLIAMSRLPFIRRHKVLGNIIFWLGLYAGFPLLCVAYCAY